MVCSFISGLCSKVKFSAHSLPSSHNSEHVNVHFIAIGGSAMHNLALALQAAGHRVSGSDDHIFEPSKSRLKAKELLPDSEGWFPERISDELDAVILGMHAHADNPELARAQELNLPIYSYPEFLYHESQDKTRVVIAGSHGKTTITSMILHILGYHDLETDFMVGAQLEGFDVMVQITEGVEFMLLEGDEYLSSPVDRRPKFLHYKPNVALLSGIAWDHVNVFPTFEDYLDQFRQFLMAIEPGGAVVYNEEDEHVKRVVEETPNEIKRFPYRTPAYRMENEQCVLETFMGDLPLEVFGKHNLSNLEGARWICNQMGVTDEQFYEAIPSFGGASRRMELLAKNDQLSVYRDFAHAPSKVAATVKAVRELYPERRFIAALELHTYSSLQTKFMPEYAGSLDAADEAYVYYNPQAVEAKRLPELSTEQVQAAFGNAEIRVFDKSAPLFSRLDEPLDDRAVVLLMSSGNFNNIDLKSWAELRTE